jgi:hypothetical protein
VHKIKSFPQNICMSYAKKITEKIAVILILIFIITFSSGITAYADEDELYLGGFAALKW